jgi:hypothetical protein
VADCECVGGCIFFNDKMANMPAVAEVMKKRFCKADFSQCARFMVFKKLGKPAVPPDLFPNQADRARELLAGA